MLKYATNFKITCINNVWPPQYSYYLKTCCFEVFLGFFSFCRIYRHICEVCHLIIISNYELDL